MKRSSVMAGSISRRARKTVTLTEGELVKERFLGNSSGLPLVIEPAVADLSLIEWAAEHRTDLQSKLTRYAGILFRGFNVRSVAEFQDFITQSCGEALEYTERSSPRSKVGGRIYTSTDQPQDQRIYLHNEQSYNLVFPNRIAFHCVTAPAQGGVTPIADSRAVLRRLDPAVVQTFRDRGYRYVRNFNGRFGLTWQEAFQTSDRRQLEGYCERSQIEYQWLPEGRLRTAQVRPALARHPLSGELTWFNHITFFHLSTLEASIREALLSGFAQEDLPNNTYYGDGADIEPAVLDELRAAYAAETVEFPWQQGDILMLDNMLAAHGRAAFSGPRKIVVAMAVPIAWRDVTARTETPNSN